MSRPLLYATFVLFTAFSLWVTFTEGYLAFLDVPRGSMWGLQITLDLVIAISLFVGWMWRDARTSGVPPLPYFLLCLTVGSIGALAYLIHRSVVSRGTPRLEATAR